MTQANNSGAGPNSERPFVTHLLELRDRLLRVLLVVLAIFLVLFSFANDLYQMVAQPLMRHLPEGSSMIATEVASPFLTPFKLTFILSIFLAMPAVLYQLWAFVAPGLYQKERRLVFPLLVSSAALFYAGMAFAYYVVFPLIFGFFINTAPQGVAVMTDISKYLDFVLKLFFAFGLAFEVPIATILLVWTGAATPKGLAAKRPYVIVGAFVFGMLLTPPDVFSQLFLAVPMWLLFELGIVFSRMFVRTKEPERQAVAATEPEPAAAGTASTAVVPEEPAQASDADEDEPEMTDEEMDAELDRIEAEEEALAQAERGAEGDEHPPKPDKPGN